MLQTDAFNEDIAAAYGQQQPYQHVGHPPTMLIFSAIPGSGKTTLAKRLWHDLKAQYINHDDIRNLIRERGIEPENLFMPPISRILVHRMISSDENKFVILDGSLDRTWEIFFDHAKELHAKTILIRIELPISVIRERLLQRDGVNGPLLGRLDQFRNDFKNCRKQVTADITVGENYDYATVLQAIRDKIPSL